MAVQESLSKLRVQRQVGVLVLEGRQLRDELQPAPWGKRSWEANASKLNNEEGW